MSQTIKVCSVSLAPSDAAPVQSAHPAFHGAAGHRNVLPVQLPPDLVGPVNLPVGVPDPLDGVPQGRIALRPGAPACRMPLG